MYFIIAFGLLLMGFSLVMIINPDYWARGIVRFSKKRYFHGFEVVSRFIAGVIFIVFSHSAQYPQLIFVIGCVLIAVSGGLLIVGEDKHRKFAVWSAATFKRTFRPAGVASLMFGAFLIYVAVR